MKKLIVFVMLCVIFYSCGNTIMKKNITESLLPEEVMQINNYEADSVILLAGYEFYEAIHDFVKELNEIPAGELTQDDKKAMEMLPKITYQDCFDYLTMSNKDNPDALKKELKENFPLLFFLNDEYEVHFLWDLEELIGSRNWIQVLKQKWDPVQFMWVNNAKFDVPYEYEKYENEILENPKIAAINDFIEDKTKSFTKDDLKLIAKDKIYFVDIPENKEDEFLNDLMNEIDKDIKNYDKDWNYFAYACNSKQLLLLMAKLAYEKYNGSYITYIAAIKNL